jgi:hypothetical protein
MFLDLFSVPWRDLELTDVERFVESASAEGLIWEGKGCAPLPKLIHKIRHGVCGLANQLGGVFIIGAEEGADERWSLPGVALGGLQESPSDWISRVITDGLVNPPAFAVRTWRRGDSMVVIVIRVEKAGEPPCMTRDGVVWQRVVGETRKVTDPRVLTGLIEQGQRARADAEARAVNAVSEAGGIPLAGSAETRNVNLALAPVLLLPDIAERLFTPDFKEALLEVTQALPASRYFDGGSAYAAQSREGYTGRRGRIGNIAEVEWAVRVTWDGTILAALAAKRDEPFPFEVMDVIKNLWRASAPLARRVVGAPDSERVPAHLALSVGSGEFVIRGNRAAAPGPPVQRWVDLGGPDADVLWSISLELQRGGGTETFL